MIVEVSRKGEDQSGDFVRFLWSDDLQECRVVQFGMKDDEVDALVAKKAHEGVCVEGYVVTCK